MPFRRTASVLLALAAAALCRAGDVPGGAGPRPATAYDLKRLRREVRGRGVVAYRVAPKTVRVAWRYLSSDPPNAAFNVYRDGRRVNSAPIAASAGSAAFSSEIISKISTSAPSSSETVV